VTAVPTTIRRARPADARELTAVAHAAKRQWGYPARWIRRWRAALTVTSAFVRAHPVYAAVRDGEVVGFYALSRAGACFELEHMWVRPDHRGAGIGRRLMRHALARIRALRGRRLEVASDPNAVGFYRRLGARRVGSVAATPRGRRLPLLVMEIRR